MFPADPHIRVNSEGSCDTEDWSNDYVSKRYINVTNYYYFSQTDI